MSGAPPPLTTQRVLALGPVLRRGAEADYRALAAGPGEPHLVRSDLGRDAGRPPAGWPADGTPLLSLAHVTDLQLADVLSPARFEFLNRYYADPRYAQIVPVQRPQEALTPHAVDATIRTLNGLTGPATGAPPQLVVTTGDAIDNAQWNELQAFLALLDGGLVSMRSPGRWPGPAYDGVQAADWPDDIFWKPDGIGPSGPDLFRRELGFPHQPGVLELAVRAFHAAGLGIPWLSCYGNHEALNQGVGVPTPELARALVGASKPVALPAGFDHDRALELFTYHPDAFMAGPTRPVRPDPGRRPVTRREFVQAHFRAGSRPAGHGFTAANGADGTAYYVHDTPAVRLIALDTTCLSGGSAGCLDHDQARWLADRLAEVHSAYRATDGALVRTGNQDRLVVVFSHHGTTTLTNSGCGGGNGAPPLGAHDVCALLHRFGNVVLWLNGHTHTNAVRAHRDPAHPAAGFWEVTTCAVVDWPCQTRLVELVAGRGRLAIVCTMVDHDSPDRPGRLDLERADGDGSLAGLASLHRELAANVPIIGAHWGREGAPADRNVILNMAPPFPPRRLGP